MKTKKFLTDGKNYEVPELYRSVGIDEIEKKGWALTPSKYIEFVDSFPMNAAGKILKYKMREEAAKRLGLVGDGSDTAGPGNK